MNKLKFVTGHGKWLLRAGWEYLLSLSYHKPVSRESISADMDELYQIMKAGKMYWVAEHHPDTEGITVTVVVAGGNIGGVELVWVGKGAWAIELWADVIPEEGELVLDEDDTGLSVEADDKGGMVMVGFRQ